MYSNFLLIRTATISKIPPCHSWDCGAFICNCIAQGLGSFEASCMWWSNSCEFAAYVCSFGLCSCQDWLPDCCDFGPHFLQSPGRCKLCSVSHADKLFGHHLAAVMFKTNPVPFTVYLSILWIKWDRQICFHSSFSFTMRRNISIDQGYTTRFSGSTAEMSMFTASASCFERFVLLLAPIGIGTRAFRTSPFCFLLVNPCTSALTFTKTK